jgi:hypothetical protein
MKLDCSAVLDVGKTHVKLRVFDAAGHVVEQRDRPNQGVSSPQGYTALDTGGIEAWLWDSLASLTHRARIGRLIAPPRTAPRSPRSMTTAWCCRWSTTSSTPMRPARSLCARRGRVARDPVTAPADGLERGRVPGTGSRASSPRRSRVRHTLLPYPQYWAGAMSGTPGQRGEFARLATRTCGHRQNRSCLGWCIAKVGTAFSRPSVRRGRCWARCDPNWPQRLGLFARLRGPQPACTTSNACLARYLRRWPAMTLVTSGTDRGDGLRWPHRCAGPVQRHARQCVGGARRRAHRPFPWAGATTRLLCAGAPPDAARASLVQVLNDEGIRALPTHAGPAGAA